MDLRTRRLLKKLVGLLGTDNEKERASALRRIDEILKRHKRTWFEMPELLGNIPDDDPRPSSAAGPAGDIGPLDLLDYILRRYVQLQDHEYLAVALWALRTHLYERFSMSAFWSRRAWLC